MPSGPEADFPCTFYNSLEEPICPLSSWTIAASSLTATAYRIWALILVNQQIFNHLMGRFWRWKAASKERTLQQQLLQKELTEQNEGATANSSSQQQKVITDGVDVEMQQTNGSRLRFSMNDES